MKILFEGSLPPFVSYEFWRLYRKIHRDFERWWIMAMRIFILNGSSEEPVISECCGMILTTMYDGGVDDDQHIRIALNDNRFVEYLCAGTEEDGICFTLTSSSYADADHIYILLTLALPPASDSWQTVED